MQGLGSTEAGVGQDLIIMAAPIASTLDQVGVLLDQAAAVGSVDAASLDDWSQQHAELGASYQRLVDRAADVASQGGDAQAAWLVEAERIAGMAQSLLHEVSSLSATYVRGRTTKIALWTGAAVLGAVGTLLTVRWYVNRKKRR